LAGQYNYDYIVTSTICPNDTANVIVIVDGSCDYTASIDEFASQWAIYPNPATALITVANHTGLVIDTIELLDLNGKVIQVVKTLQPIENTLDINSLETGLYLINVKAGGQTLTKRFIKQ
jgi:hypothetical protein